MKATELHQQEGCDFMSAVLEVHNEMGGGFLERVYQESLAIKLTRRGIPFVSKPKLPIFHKGQSLKNTYEADLIVTGEIIVELKAVKALLPEHEAQPINALKPRANVSTTPSISRLPPARMATLRVPSALH